MIDARVSWFSGWMGEENSDMAHWRERWNADESTVYDAVALVAIFEKTWHVIANALERWTPADLEQVFSPPDYLQEEESAHTRQWIIWHVLEHEIHHGGELSLALGTYGLEDFYTW
jgi:uncharacterized damage-inducible protein DinB